MTTVTTATDTESALLAAILANTEDDLPRLVYAEWLEENAGEVECGRCEGGKRVVVCPDCVSWKGRVPKDCRCGGKRRIDCPACSGSGRVSDGRMERSEFIRCQIALSQPCDPWCRVGLVQQSIQEYRANAGGVVVVGQRDAPCPKCQPLRRRERELFDDPARVLSWFSVPKGWVARLEPFDRDDPDHPYFTVSRGFVAHVTASYATLFGGECGRCGRTHVWRPARVERDVMTVLPCDVCGDTRHTPGIAADLFRAQPVMGVTLVGKEPLRFTPDNGSSSFDEPEMFAWGRLGRQSLNEQHWIADELWDWIDYSNVRTERYKRFPTRDLALQAASAAAVSLGRQRAAKSDR